jgi:hypothetical protein
MWNDVHQTPAALSDPVWLHPARGSGKAGFGAAAVVQGRILPAFSAAVKSASICRFTPTPILSDRDEIDVNRAGQQDDRVARW